MIEVDVSDFSENLPKNYPKNYPKMAPEKGASDTRNTLNSLKLPTTISYNSEILRLQNLNHIPVEEENKFLTIPRDEMAEIVPKFKIPKFESLHNSNNNNIPGAITVENPTETFNHRTKSFNFQQSFNFSPRKLRGGFPSFKVAKVLKFLKQQNALDSKPAEPLEPRKQKALLLSLTASPDLFTNGVLILT